MLHLGYIDGKNFLGSNSDLAWLRPQNNYQTREIHYQYSRGVRIALERLLNPKFDPEFVPRAAHDPKVLNAEAAKSEAPSEEKKKAE